MVFATGMDTEFGKIAHLTQTVGEELSPLQKEMGRVTRIVTILATAIGAFFFLLAILLAGVNLAESFIFAMGMIVAFVPEGMLPTVTLALAMAVQRMARRHALVKRLSAVETLGCTTVICTDKTGTLTQNEMTVSSIWVPGTAVFSDRRRLCAAGPDRSGRPRPVGSSPDDGNPRAQDVQQLLLAAGLCNNARLLPPNGDDPHWTVLGDPTEAALRVAALKGGLDLEAEAARDAAPARVALRFPAQADEHHPCRSTTAPVALCQRRAERGAGTLHPALAGRAGAAADG